MSREIDEKIVSMKFNNKDFEKNVGVTLSTIEKLKSKLNFKESLKGFEQLDKSAKKVDMTNLQNGVETVKLKLSAMEVIGITALTNIANSAINTGKQLVSALTIDPIKTGLDEYETQINAIQTILANTEGKGSNLTQVNAALDELNTYADKTIYNFTEMTRNIGTFTAAGVDLDKSVSSIKGIANLAAVSGSTSQQASVAMYQLSQALAAGTVKLQDWNSVVNAGMGGQIFQDALKRTATHMGKNVDELIKKYGSFRESLTQGNWLTTEVLTETLTQLSGAYSKADLIAQGYTEKQADEISKLAETAVNAATKVKTVTQLWDTLKEAAQSGWTQSWEIIIGDFEESKDLLTSISDSAGAIIQETADKRNKLLSNLSTGYKQFINEGISDTVKFDETFKLVAKDHGIAIDDMVAKTGSFEKACQQGWVTGDMLKETVSKMAESYASMSAEQKKNAGVTSETIDNVNKLNTSLQNGSLSADDFAKKFNRLSGRQNVIAGLSSAVNTLGKYISSIKEAWKDVFPDMQGETLYKYTEEFKKFCESLKPTEERLNNLKRTFEGLFSILDIFKKGLETVIKTIFNFVNSDGASSLIDLLLSCTASIGDFFTSLDNGFETTSVTESLGKVVTGISNLVVGVTGSLHNFADALGIIGGYVSKFVGSIWNGFGKLFGWITDNISTKDIFAGLFGAGVFQGVKTFSGLLDKIEESVGKISGIVDEVKGILHDKLNFKETSSDFSSGLAEIHDALRAFTSGIKTVTLVSIATSIGILTASLKTISKIKMVDVTKGLTAMGVMFFMLDKSFKSISKIVSGNNLRGIVKSGAALILMSQSIKILGKALTIIAKIDGIRLTKSLVALPIALKILISSMKSIEGVKVSVSSMLAITVISKACGTLAKALQEFGKMSWDKIARGLTAMGGALTELSIITKLTDKYFGKASVLSSVSLNIAVKSLTDMADGLSAFGKMSWKTITRGLAGMGGALSEISIITGVAGKLAKTDSIKSSTALVIAVQSLSKIATFIKQVSVLSWEDIAKGLSAMGGALTELSLSIGILSKLGKGKSLFVSASMLIAVQSLEEISKFLQRISFLSWEEIAKGLAGMGGAFAELAIVTGLLGKLAGLSGLVGAATILIAVQSLEEISKALQKIGKLKEDEVIKGLAGLGGALVELGVVSGLLGTLTGLSGLLGAGTIVVAVSSLGELADALKKFGSMSWYEINRGLDAMGKALGNIAIGNLANTLGGLGALTIAKVAKPIGELADSVKKWQDVYISSNMKPDLINLSEGIKAFTLGGFGANTISKIAQPLGVLAESLKRWEKVNISPNIKPDLVNLSEGVKSFTLGGWGADTISTLAKPIGTLADSIKKWEDVSVSPNVKPDLINIADGIKSFTLGGWGADTITKVSSSLGTLADSLSKWENVYVSPNTEADLIRIATGVKAFTFAFGGGFSIDMIIKPLSNLADSVKKWEDVNVSPNAKPDMVNIAEGVKAFTFAAIGGFSIDLIAKPLGKLADSINKWKDVSVSPNVRPDLINIAEGVKAFTFAGPGGFSISTICAPLGTLADSIKKWADVYVSPNVKPDLTNIAEGVKAFSSTGVGGAVLSEIAKPLGTLADSLSKWTNLTFPGNISNDLSTLATALRLFGSVGDISSSLSALKSVVSSLEKLSGINIPSISSGIVGLGSAFVTLGSNASSLAGVGSLIVYNIVNPLENCKTRVTNAVAGIMSTISSAANSNSGTVKTAFSNIVEAILTTLNGKAGKFEKTGQQFGTNMANGINGKREAVVSAVANMAAAASNASGNIVHYNTFYSNGAYLIQGFINGMKSKKKSAIEAGSEIASAAAKASAKALQEHSPSKIGYGIGAYYGEGLVNGVISKVKATKDAGTALANASIDSVRNTMSKAKELLNNVSTNNPVLTPLMDLSNVNSGFSQVETMFDRSRSLALASSINVQSQAQSLRETVDNAVNSAIGKLNENIQNGDKETNVTIEVPVNIDGREVAKATAPYTKKEIDKIQTRNDRKRGIL